MAVLSARRAWNQWQAFSIGNSIIGALLLVFVVATGRLGAVWGTATSGDIALGLLVGAVPLAVIVTLIFTPGQLSRDIVAAGLGKITPRQFVYRVGVQVALTTVLFEEFAFRGLLHYLLLQSVTAGWAVALDALVYGLWHTLLQYYGFDSRQGAARWLATIGATGIYTALGVGLAVTRQISGGMLAPLVAHGVLDVLMFVAMFVRRSGYPTR